MTAPPPQAVRDLWPRLLLSPVFGLAIPHASGLIDHTRHSSASLALAYAWFSLTALVVWTGNRWIYLRLPWRDQWLRRPWRRVGLLVLAIVAFTVPTSTAFLVAWRWAAGDEGTHALALPTAVLAIVATVAVITHVYETMFLLRDWESDRLRTERLERERLEADLDALRREVDPHLLFNNLNVLVDLIERGSERAVPFIEALSDTYRYVLAARARPLVPLREELRMLRRHHLLANLRYGEAICLDVRVTDDEADAFALPPVTLGELFLNAVKHNAITAGTPLRFEVALAGETLVVSNTTSPRTRASASTGVGLRNLADRVRLALAGPPPRWGQEGDLFVVRLPLAHLWESADEHAPDA